MSSLNPRYFVVVLCAACVYRALGLEWLLAIPAACVTPYAMLCVLTCIIKPVEYFERKYNKRQARKRREAREKEREAREKEREARAERS
jgi:hypothetical protein